MLILASATWCGHCKSFKNIWSQFKQKYGNVIDIRELDADKNPKIIKELKVQGFPTIILLNNGKRIEYNGPRTMSGLESFVKDNLKLKGMQRGGGNGLSDNTLYFAKAQWCSHCQKFAPTFSQFESKYGNLVKIQKLDADTPSDKPLIQALGVQGFPTIVLMKNGQKIEFEGTRDMKSLEKFVKDNLNIHVNDDLNNYRAL